MQEVEQKQVPQQGQEVSGLAAPIEDDELPTSWEWKNLCSLCEECDAIQVKPGQTKWRMLRN